MALEILEGTWEEIAQHAAEFSGKRVRLTLIEPHPQPPIVAERSLAEALQGIVGAIDSSEESPDRHPPTPFSEILAEKFRKQGLKIP